MSLNTFLAQIWVVVQITKVGRNPLFMRIAFLLDGPSLISPIFFKVCKIKLYLLVSKLKKRNVFIGPIKVIRLI